MIWVLKNTLKYSCACFQDGAEFNFQNDSSPRQTVAFVFVFYVKDLSILNPKGKQAHSLGRKEDIRWWRGLKLRICWAVTPDTWQGSYQTGTNTTSPREGPEWLLRLVGWGCSTLETREERLQVPSTAGLHDHRLHDHSLNCERGKIYSWAMRF